MSTASPIHSRLVARSGMELLPVTWFMVYQTAVAPGTHRSRRSIWAVDYVPPAYSSSVTCSPHSLSGPSAGASHRARWLMR